MMEDKTDEIFSEVYDEDTIKDLILNTYIKYPFLLEASLEYVKMLAIQEERFRRYYSQDSSTSSNHFQSKYQYNKDKGYSNE